MRVKKLMSKRLITVISSISNSLCDFTLDIAVNKYNTYKILFLTSIISFILQIIYALVFGISFTYQSLPIIFLYGLIILAGYLSYIKALQNIPIGLASLLENTDLFIVLTIDIILGYIKLTNRFIILFILFIISIIWFCFETNKIKDEIKLKKINFIGIVFILLSVFFYALEPYIIKKANSLGANEVAINFGYYFLAIPFFLYKSSKNKDNNNTKKNKKILLIVLLIGFFEAIYYIGGTIGYIYETPIIVNIIQEIRVFILVILSFIFKTDKINLKKTLSIALGMFSIAGIYLFC